MNTYYVYIMADRHRGTLYTGMTNDLERRVSEHKAASTPGFTSRYHVHTLVYYEDFTDVFAAITREKQIKGWTRAKKIALFESVNPRWEDLSEAWWHATPRPQQPVGDPLSTPPLPPIPSRRRSSPLRNVVVAQNDKRR